MKRLFDLDPNEVSLVPRGANRKKFLVFKSMKGKEMAETDLRTLIKTVDPKTMASVARVVKSMAAKKAAVEGEDSVEKGPEAGEPTEGGLSERAQAALKAVARILAPFKDEISDEHMDAVQSEVGIAPEEDADEATPADEKVKMSMETPEGVDKPHHGEAMAEAQKAYMGHLEKLGYQKYPEQQPKVGSAGVTKDKNADEDDEEEEPVSKVQKTDGALDLSAFAPGQRTQLEAVFKSNADLVQKNADLEKELKIERDHRLTKEFEEKAKGFRHLGTNTAELAEVLKSLGADQLPKVEAILKAADEQARVAARTGGLFTEIGSRQGHSAGGAHADQLEALVDATVQKSDGKKTREQIYEDVLKTAEGKRLYREHQAARPGGI